MMSRLDSIAVNKVADFIILSDDPLQYQCSACDDADCDKPHQISSIKVGARYLGGKAMTEGCSAH